MRTHRWQRMGDGAGRIGCAVALFVLAGAVSCADTSGSPDPLRAPPGALPPPNFSPDPGTRAAVTLVGRVPGIPTGLAAAPDGSELLVSNQAGLVTRIPIGVVDGSTVPSSATSVYVDLSGDTVPDPQAGGLLNIAMTPDGAHLLVDRNTPDGAITLTAFDYRPGADARPEDGRVVARFPHPFVHSGGGLTFDANGDLLLSVGAFTVPGTPTGDQQPDGVVVRVPAAHLPGSLGAFEPTTTDLVARGLRNPWRLAIDPTTRTMWVGDVGEDSVEEVNVVDLAGAVGPPNFGWPYFQGRSAFVEPAPDLEFTSPVHSYSHDRDHCAVVGGPVVRGGPVALLDGRYLLGDYCGKQVRALGVDTPGSAEVVADLDEDVVAFGVGAGGEVYVLGSGGGVFRLDPPGWEVPDAAAPDPVSSPSLPAAEPGEGPGGAVCRIAVAVEAMAGSEAFTPEDFRTGVINLRDVTRRETPRLPDSLRGDGEYLVRSYDAASEEFRRFGWDPARAEVRRWIRLVGAERGEFPSTHHAQFRIMNRSQRC